MPLRIVPDEIKAERHREFFRNTKPQTPEIANTAAALGLNLPDFIEYAGVLYRVAPVSWEAGQELAKWQHEAATIKRDSAEERTMLRRLVAIYRTLVVPRGRIRRAFWWVTRNPFRYATDGEIAQLLAFFCGCRMKSRVRYPKDPGSLIRSTP